MRLLTALFLTVAAPVAAQTTFTVTTTADAGAGSLRQAITDANATAGADRIEFAIPTSDSGCDGNGVCTLQPTSELPPITNAVVIDGLTQAGASCDAWPATLNVVLNGELAGSSFGLQLRSSDNTVQGMVVNGFNASSVYSGIRIEHNAGVENADRNRVFCNYIGTDVTGTQRVPNGVGVHLSGNLNHIGGPEEGQRNLISGNDSRNIYMRDFGSGGSNNLIRGNYIGPEVTGMKALPVMDGFAFEDGIVLFGPRTSADNVIGGTDHSPRTCGRACNLISGNGGYGIVIGSPSGTLIQGNFIGPDISGTTSISREAVFGAGVYVFGAFSTRIGGTEPGAGNLISGSGWAGVSLSELTTGTRPGGILANTFVEGNRIGTDASGTQPLGNWGPGIRLYRSPFGTVKGVHIGGTETGAGNIIAFNNQAGILISGTGNTGNRFLGNAIFGNQRGEDAFGQVYDTDGLGIDLGGDGITANDPGDTDSGSNGRTNTPVLTPTVTTTSAGGASVQGTYSGKPDETFRLEFFASPQCHPSRFGEGERFLGHLDVTTDGQGEATFASSLTADVPGGWVVTATATGTEGTSEFSRCAEYPENGLTVTTTDDAGPGSLRDAILITKGMPGEQTISFNILGDGPHIIQLEDDLPLLNGPMRFDGLSQPGSICGAEGRDLMVGVDGAYNAYYGLNFVEGATRAEVIGMAFGRSKSSGIRMQTEQRGSVIECTHVGLDPAGTEDWPIDNPESTSSFTYGVFANVEQSVIGRAGRGNLIGNTSWVGLGLSGDSNRVHGNYVGVGFDGMARPNSGVGVEIRDGSEGNLIGGTEEGEGNAIAFSGRDGVRVLDSTDGSIQPARTDRNAILGNAIYANDGEGINLCQTNSSVRCDEATANDATDEDDGPNRWQNHPLIESIGITDGTVLQATYHVPTAPEHAAYPLRVEFFLADDMGQGQIFLGHDTYTEADYTAGGDKTASFSLRAPYVTDGLVIATATDAEGNTSEFGAPNVSVGAERDPSLPTTFELLPPWPNPIRQRATVRVALPEPSRLAVEVFDILGRRVRQLDDAHRPAGWHDLTLDADGLASGVYLVRMTAGDHFEAVRRITVAR
ncbi:MAG: hypothetical protein Rubg2KO_24660 [Rubricoccaceae bacterium]